MTVLELINELMKHDYRKEVYIKNNWVASPVEHVFCAHKDDNAPVTRAELQKDVDNGWIEQELADKVCERPLVVVIDGDM